LFALFHAQALIAAEQAVRIQHREHQQGGIEGSRQPGPRRSSRRAIGAVVRHTVRGPPAACGRSYPPPGAMPINTLWRPRRWLERIIGAGTELLGPSQAGRDGLGRGSCWRSGAPRRPREGRDDGLRAALKEDSWERPIGSAGSVEVGGRGGTRHRPRNVPLGQRERPAATGRLLPVAMPQGQRERQQERHSEGPRA
jgi:hypothetical protein